MQIGDFLFAVFPLNITRNVVHRPRTVQRHNSDKVFKTVGLNLFVNILHARRFKLEDGGSVAALQKLIGLLVVQRHIVHIHLNAVNLLNPVDGALNNGQGL